MSALRFALLTDGYFTGRGRAAAAVALGLTVACAMSEAADKAFQRAAGGPLDMLAAWRLAHGESVWAHPDEADEACRWLRYLMPGAVPAKLEDPLAADDRLLGYLAGGERRTRCWTAWPEWASESKRPLLVRRESEAQLCEAFEACQEGESVLHLPAGPARASCFCWRARPRARRRRCWRWTAASWRPIRWRTSGASWTPCAARRCSTAGAVCLRRADAFAPPRAAGRRGGRLAAPAVAFVRAAAAGRRGARVHLHGRAGGLSALRRPARAPHRVRAVHARRADRAVAGHGRGVRRATGRRAVRQQIPAQPAADRDGRAPAGRRVPRARPGGCRARVRAGAAPAPRAACAACAPPIRWTTSSCPRAPSSSC